VLLYCTRASSSREWPSPVELGCGGDLGVLLLSLESDWEAIAWASMLSGGVDLWADRSSAGGAMRALLH
jgi:hypothetical protein